MDLPPVLMALDATVTIVGPTNTFLVSSIRTSAVRALSITPPMRVCPVTFAVAGSGHIAGVVNPPYQVKYSHWVDGPFVSNIETWLDRAKERLGSWWPHWLQWIREHDPTEVSPRIPGRSKLEPLEDAPGSYVRVKN